MGGGWRSGVLCGLWLVVVGDGSSGAWCGGRGCVVVPLLVWLCSASCGRVSVPGLVWSYMGSRGRTLRCGVVPGLVWSYMGSRGRTLRCGVVPGLVWSYMGPRGRTLRCRVVPWGGFKVRLRGAGYDRVDLGTIPRCRGCVVVGPGVRRGPCGARLGACGGAR